MSWTSTLLNQLEMHPKCLIQRTRVRAPCLRLPRTSCPGIRHASQQFGPFSAPDPDEDSEKKPRREKTPSGDKELSRLPATFYKMFESAATTFASLAVLGLAGYGYHRYYKNLVLKKMENAFAPGDPVLELAGTSATSTPEATNVATEEADEYIAIRPEQDFLDAVVSGETRGRYFLLIGEKGTGKSSMLLEAMRK